MSIYLKKIQDQAAIIWASTKPAEDAKPSPLNKIKTNLHAIFDSTTNTSNQKIAKSVIVVGAGLFVMGAVLLKPVLLVAGAVAVLAALILFKKQAKPKPTQVELELGDAPRKTKVAPRVEIPTVATPSADAVNVSQAPADEPTPSKPNAIETARKKVGGFIQKQTNKLFGSQAA